MSDPENGLTQFIDLLRSLRAEEISGDQLRSMLEFVHRESSDELSEEEFVRILRRSTEHEFDVGSVEIRNADIDQIIKKAQATLSESNLKLPQNLIVLVGLLGDSPRGRDYKRLYLTLQLNDYVEFNVDDVVLHEKAGLSSIQGMIVWFKQDAVIERVRSESLQGQRGFFQGDIAVSNFMLYSGSNMGQGSVDGGSFHCGGGSFHCGGGSFHCGGGSFHCGGGSFHCGGGSFHCGGGSFHCGGGSFHCGGGSPR